MLIQKKCSPISMKVSVQLTYSYDYFVKFPHTGADLIAHLLFVFVIHMRQQVKHEMKSHKNQTSYRWNCSGIHTILHPLKLSTIHSLFPFKARFTAFTAFAAVLFVAMDIICGDLSIHS